MKKIDYHMHTMFSADSYALPKEHIEQAIAMGLDEICFTDHFDYNYPNMPFLVDVNSYFTTMRALKEEYQDKIKIKIGVEVGLDMNYVKEINDFVNSYPFDFVIGSIHAIEDTEFFYPGDFFNGLTKTQAHQKFFEHTLKCVETFDCFNVLGHLDYIVRYGPYEDKSVDHQYFDEIITKILKTLIHKGKGIEVNTSGYKVLKTCGFPNFDIVKKYYDLGGRIITVGTDSHTSDRVGENVEDVLKHYQEIGFKNVSTFSNRVVE